MIKRNVNYRPAVTGTHGEMFKCTVFWVKFGNAFAYFVVSCSLARWRYNSI